MRAAAARFVLWFFATLIAAAGFWGAFALGRRTAAASGSVSSAPVVLAMKKIAQLATVEVEVADVVRYEEIRTMLLVFDFPKSATLRLRGRVMGGFDLQNPDFGITADGPGRVVHMRLPRPRLLALDPRFEWFDEKSGWINPITPEDRNRWMLWARGALGRAAKDAGIEAKAVEQARELLSGSARAFGWTADVTVAGGDPAPPPTPGS
ncbi:MAG TPA: DUF4230 domain-containing protein [Thermoanaerobaculia bacterium]|nr:DUF4230 domain-containing protein [Thermoanaerobaculia bacterium]